MIDSSLTQLLLGGMGSEIVPDILAFLAIPAIAALCCTCAASRRIAYSCRRLTLHPADAQGVALLTRASSTLKQLVVTSAVKLARVTNQEQGYLRQQHPEELMTRVFATLRTGVMHYLQELTIHLSVRAPWATIARNLFHDAVKVGSVIRLKQLDYRLDGSKDDDLVADICTHCPDLRTIRLTPSHLWYQSPRAKSDFVALMTQPRWPNLEHLELESYASIPNFPFATPEALATALNKTRFPSLISMALTLQGAMNTDQFIWDLISRPHATVMPNLRELQFITAEAPPQVPGVWSQDSYMILPRLSQLEPFLSNNNSRSSQQMPNENPEAHTDSMLSSLRELQFSSLQSLRFPREMTADFSYYSPTEVVKRMNARLSQTIANR